MLESNQILQERYKLKEKLGQHSGRQTWLAEDISIEPVETVILKFLASSEELQWQDLKLFEREADILKQLSHAGIPDYLDYFTVVDDSSYFALVEEHLPGKSLKQLIERKQRFTEKELQNIAIDVLEILCYLHTLNPLVIHRDIKPSNLILGEDKRVYLIDFGAVQDSATAQGATFTVVGTYGYAPVEQFGGRTVPASDLYGLGATLIHLATGIIPADLPQTKMRIQFQDKVSLTTGFIRWIEKLTEPDIDDRFSTAEEALGALNNYSEFDYSNSNSIDNFDSEIAKPIRTRIKLNKSNNQLKIEIPTAIITAMDIYIILVSTFFVFLMLTIFSMFNIPFSSISCSIIVLLIFIFRYSRKFYIIFNREYFLIQWKLFNFTYFMKQGTISEIIYFAIDDNLFGKIKTIIMKTEAEKYKSRVYLSDSERKWLSEVMKDWIDG